MDIKYNLKQKNEGDIFLLYEGLGWNEILQSDQKQLDKAMEQSWQVVYAYEGEKLIGTGRVVSDGIINAYLCGLGVLPDYRNKGIGTEIFNRLINHCKRNNLHVQLLCKEELIPYYENMGFKVFSVGMKG